MLESCYVCSPRTYSLIKDKWALKDLPLYTDYHCPNYTKLKGQGRKKLYGLVYKIKAGHGVDTLLIENIYDWRKEK